MYKITSVEKDAIEFIKEGETTHFAALLTPIIYEYTPGATMVLINGDYWHDEDLNRYKYIEKLIGMEFETYEEMLSKCKEWRV